MARYIGHVTSPRPIEDVFDYLADFSDVRDWDPSAVESRALNGGGVAEGLRYAVTSRFLGERYRSPRGDRDRASRPRRPARRERQRRLAGHDELRKLPDGGTEVTYDADLQLRGRGN